MISHTAAPSDEERGKINQVLGNVALLNAARHASPALLDRDQLVSTLKDSATPDDQWLRVFRQYAVRFLLGDQP
jgi:hypothetical protein